MLYIKRDMLAESPRHENNLGKMVCWHKRYKLGDEQPEQLPYVWFAEFKQQHPDAIILPLYLLVHSGLTISTFSFHDPWDSGQIGWIVADLDPLLTKEQLKQILLTEVETYDAWLQGDVWYFETDEGDACWGFYGDSLETTGLLEAIPEYTEAQIREAWSKRA